MTRSEQIEQAPARGEGGRRMTSYKIEPECHCAPGDAYACQIHSKDPSIRAAAWEYRCKLLEERAPAPAPVESAPLTGGEYDRAEQYRAQKERTDGFCPNCRADIGGPLAEAYDAGHEAAATEVADAERLAAVESAPGACTCAFDVGTSREAIAERGPHHWERCARYAPASPPAAEPGKDYETFPDVWFCELHQRALEPAGVRNGHCPACAAEPGTCPHHKMKWIEGTACPRCGGRRFWHSGMGETTTDEHQKCIGPCGMDRYVDGIDS